MAPFTGRIALEFADRRPRLVAGGHPVTLLIARITCLTALATALLAEVARLAADFAAAFASAVLPAR